MGINSVCPEPASKPDPEPVSESESDPEPEKASTFPEPLVLNPEPEPEPKRTTTASILNQTSVREEPMNSSPLLYLPAKIKNVDVHFMVDSGATNNFLSQDLVHQLNLPTNKLKNPINITFADGRIQSIQRYCLVRVPFDPRYQPLLKFYVANIAHDAYLGQPWLTSDHGISINWPSGVVHVKPDITMQGVRREEKQLSLMSACQFKKAVKNDPAFLCVVRPQEPEKPKNTPSTSDPALETLLKEYSDVFPDELPKELPPERSVDHRIDLLPDSVPVAKPTYKMSLAEMDELRRQLDDLLSRGFIRPSSSPYGSPVLFVKKKDGDLRMCVDYRALNKQTVKNTYPLPRIDELLDRLHGAVVFSKIDLRSGYHQIRVQEVDIHKTAFRTRYGLFEFVVLPFGLCNAPATFMRLMNDIFRDELDRCVIIYLDDICIFSPSVEQHLRDIRTVLEKLRQHRLYAKLSKCEFLKEEILFLGHRISAAGLRMDPDKIKAIIEWPDLTCVPDVLSFLGLVNYYHKYVEHLADIAIPLSDLLKSENPFVWGPDQITAFRDLKNAIASDPILSHFVPTDPVEIHCDASNKAVGCAMIQNDHPVAFESRKLSAAELNYPTHDKELLAIVHALTKWRTYLHGSTVPIKIFSDHESLKCLATQPTLNHRQARWLEKLAEFNYEIEYTPGPMNVVPDALSRRPDYNLATASESAPAIGQKFLDSIRSKIPDDKDFGPIVARLQALPHDDPHSEYRLETGLLFLREGERMCIPDDPEIKTILLQEAHDSALAGHPGLDKTYTRLARVAYWPNMRRHVEKYVKSCHTCRVSKTQTSKPSGLLQPLPLPDRPWSHIAMDLIIHLPKSKQQNDAVAVFVDRFSKAAHFVPCRTSCSAQDLADLFFKNVVRLHGLPTSIVSDRDARFCSQFWTQLFSRLGTRLDTATAYHQQTDGQSERTIQTLEQYLRVFVEKDHSNWDELLDQAEFTYNSNKSASTNLSPFEAMYGFQPPTPVSVALSGSEKRSDTDEFLKDHVSRFKVIKDALLDAQRRMSVQYDRKRQDCSFKIGDLVYLDATDLKKPPGLAHKLFPRYRGPFKIIGHPSPLNYRLDLPPGSKAHDVFHVEKLLLAHERDQELFPTSDEPIPDDSPITDDLGDYYEDEYEVQKLLAHRFDSKGNLQYKVRWLGFTDQDDSWQTLEDVATAPDAIRNYRQSLSSRSLTKHDAVLKRMIDEAPDGSPLKSGNVIEMVISKVL